MNNSVDKINSIIDEDFDNEVYIQFELNDKCYGAELLNIKEVLPLPELTPIPKTPSYYKGLMNLRGHVISVIDIKSKMNIPLSNEKKEIKESNEITHDNPKVVMVVGNNDFKIGIIVDKVTKVLTLSENQIAMPDNEDYGSIDYVTGLYRDNQNITTIINFFKLLDVTNLNNIKSKVA